MCAPERAGLHNSWSLRIVTGRGSSSDLGPFAVPSLDSDGRMSPVAPESLPTVPRADWSRSGSHEENKGCDSDLYSHARYLVKGEIRRWGEGAVSKELRHQNPGQTDAGIGRNHQIPAG
ncbi:hypothetical protein NL676_007038 [Syzygium grande]|nr:hypothetical protein NL676_007038 [Syzygium grande]